MQLKNSSAVFNDLNSQEEYFAIVSTISAQSFYGPPPAAIRPAAAGKLNSLSTSQDRAAQSDHLQDDILDDNHDGSSAGGDLDDNDMDSKFSAASRFVQNDATVSLTCQSTEWALPKFPDWIAFQVNAPCYHWMYKRNN